MYSFQLFLISSASTRSLLFMSFIVPIFQQNVPLISPIFLKRSLVFPLLSSSCFILCSLEKAFLSLLAILWKYAFSWIYLYLSFLLFASLFSLAICRASSVTLPSCFSFLGGWFCSLPPVQYYGPPLIVLQAHFLQVLIP